MGDQQLKGILLTDRHPNTRVPNIDPLHSLYIHIPIALMAEILDIDIVTIYFGSESAKNEDFLLPCLYNGLIIIHFNSNT